ncbi:hypothetical protein JMK10_17535 [Rhodovulum sulfidophilum]|uniref:hypothetical protein n=1 Tax=Rhodovulum sulfidophilum TaxID=35806 RepID=UPI0019241A7B|nr:hypothetical protein [Rhodovulum sulfidophilum]MBL3575101.1 hypothetical protein [Rhodovulum sulfidophilum]MCE8430724.1 hypothetical protein [Rhodovulum sulfidophilum]MCF4118563.1 hypothetical protein [Rhodovulum sulfidophilum]
MPLSPATPSLARRAALPAAFAALSLASLLIGAKDIGIGWIFDPSPEALLVLTASRLPRLIALVLTGEVTATPVDLPTIPFAAIYAKRRRSDPALRWLMGRTKQLLAPQDGSCSI